MSDRPPLEFWGGVECTVNRVAEDFTDQMHLTGHHDRIEDLDAFAALGLSALRYPLLWERIAPDRIDTCDWGWSDARMARLRSLGIKPIAGLVHHGSGPRYTDLLDPQFADKLARFAGEVAERYDWVADWTPINEPLTTARFSALYGHWYPHRRDEPSFWLALLNQIDGVRAAMRAVRHVRPDARLIQTDDLGRSYATSTLQDQAAFDNERRWAGWDLLFGRLKTGHPLWDRLAKLGFADRLRAIADDPCPPDVVGVNHYLTSDRFLDHRLDRYPRSSIGGNGSARYADVAAVRVLDPAPDGLRLALEEAWERYAVPLALTEVHNGCTREEQMRWAARAWDTAVALRDKGVDVCAVTAWSMLGSKGWDRLLTAPGAYEPGLYDVRGERPRATALAKLWTDLSKGRSRHPVTIGDGWWQRPIRLLHDPIGTRTAPVRRLTGEPVRPLLILGATGTLGGALARACVHRGLGYAITDRTGLDLLDESSIERALDRIEPWTVVNAAGWVRVDDAEDDPEACRRINATGAIALARACSERGIGCVNFSSDLVFDGCSDTAYQESDSPRPIGAYGRSKLELEQGCLELPGAQLVIRTAAFFSPDDPYNFAFDVRDALTERRPFRAAGDHVVTPTYVPHLVDAVLDLVIDGEAGIWHLTNEEALSWADFARRIAQACGLDPSLIEDRAGQAFKWRAARPFQAALVSVRGSLLPPLQSAIDSFAASSSSHRLARAAHA